jgi:hypothetical protein
MENAARQFLRQYIRDSHKRLNDLSVLKRVTIQEVSLALPREAQDLLFEDLTAFGHERYRWMQDKHAAHLDHLRSVHNHRSMLSMKTRGTSGVNTSVAAQKNWVVNLLDRDLSKDELSVLSKGMNFSVAQRKVPVRDILCGIEKGIRSLSNLKKTEVRGIVSSLLLRHRSKTVPSNLSQAELKALRELGNDTKLKIVPADKGNATVVMKAEDYSSKMSVVLSNTANYKELKKDTSQQIARKFNSTLYGVKSKLGEQLYRRLRAPDAQTPEMYGLVKLHKEGHPMRPIVSYTGSALYSFSTWVSEVLSPLAGNTQFHVRNSADFAKDVRAITLDPGEIIVSYDVVGLFPSIPIDFALQIISDVIAADVSFESRCTLSRSTILSLIEFLLKSTVFKFEGRVYEQVSGVPMGSPCSVVISNLVMERVENEALRALGSQPKFYRRFIDDIFTVIHVDLTDDFRDCLNGVHQNIQVTIEKPHDNCLPFLDVLVKMDGGRLTTRVYRKPTNTGRYLSFGSAHPTSQKKAVVRTLVHRARDICQSPSDERNELAKIRSDLLHNGYPNRLIDSCFNYSPPTSPVPAQQWLGYACFPFVRGLSEQLTRILADFGVKAVHIPAAPLRKWLHRSRSRPDTLQSTNVVYEIPCSDCSSTYVGQTCRFLSKRVREHRSDKKSSSALTEHIRDSGHSPDYDQTIVLSKKDRYFDRIWCEAWEIASREMRGCALSNRNSGSVTIPDQYRPFC